MQNIILNNDDFFAGVIEMLKEGKKVEIPVKGTSMLPFIRPLRDTVVLEPGSGIAWEKCHEPKKGDIVLFRFRGRYILHRIISVRDGQATIMGDGVIGAKEYCPTDEIIAKATTLNRGGKKLISFDSWWMRFLSSLWALLPLRRYLLAIYKRLPWNSWLRK